MEKVLFPSSSIICFFRTILCRLVERGNSFKTSVTEIVSFSAQTPAPAYDITITPSENSARVSWKLQTTASASSYITNVRIFASQNGWSVLDKTISRGTEINIERLNPKTRYTVKVQTLDGSSQRSEIVSQDFQTEEITGKNQSTLVLMDLNQRKCQTSELFQIFVFVILVAFWFGFHE